MEEIQQRLTANERGLAKELAAAVQTARPNVQLPKSSGNENVRRFLDTVDNVARANRWDEALTALHLRLALEGPASTGVRGRTVEELKQSLLRKYSMTQEESRVRLRDLKLRSENMVYDVGEQIRQLVSTAHPALDVRQQEEEAVLALTEAVGDRYLKHEFRLQPPTCYDDAIDRVRSYFCDMGKERCLIQSLNVEEADKVDKLEKAMDILQHQVAMITVKQEQTDTQLEGLSASISQKLDQILAGASATPRPYATFTLE